MVQKSGVHQLRLVVHPIIYEGFLYIPGGAKFLPSTAMSPKKIGWKSPYKWWKYPGKLPIPRPILRIPMKQPGLLFRSHLKTTCRYRHVLFVGRWSWRYIFNRWGAVGWKDRESLNPYRIHIGPMVTGILGRG